MNNKGYTLIEIIAVVAILGIVGIAIFVGFNKAKNPEKEKKKIVSDIISAADVYFSMNSAVKEKADKNYGYCVLSIDDLKKEGMLDINKKIPEASAEEISQDKSYDKMVINTTDDSLGFVDFIYPFEKGTLLIVNLNDIYIEAFEKNLFKCNTELNKIDYMDENYEVQSLANFSCGLEQFDGNTDKTIYFGKNNQVTNLQDNNNKLRYKVSVNGKAAYGDRNVYVNSEYSPHFTAKIVDTNTNYSCGETWTNKEVLLSFDQNDSGDRNLSFTWYKDGNLINDESEKNFVATENGVYSGEYILKGKISPTTKTGNGSCEVKIDKTLPIIDVSTVDNQIEVSIADSESGVYGYLKSDRKKEIINLNKTNFTQGNSFQFGKSFYTKTYYIYAMDNAGNIVEKIYQSAGEENYPSITYEPIEDSFTKFKVTIKDISGKDYNIDDIKVQYQFDNNRYKYYEDNFKPGRDNEWYLKNFLENFKYNKDYPTNQKNYIDYKKYTEDYICNEKECSFIIDMYEVIEKGSNNRTLKRIVDYDDLYNLSLNYYIYAKNSEGYYKELNLNSKLNIYEDEGAFQGNWFEYNKWMSTLRGTNSRGDILFTEYDSSRDSKSTTVYYYNNEESYAYDLGTYWNWKQITYDWFDDYSLGFTTCTTYTQNKKNYKQYYRYEYILDTGEFYAYDSYERRNNSRCNFKTNATTTYKTSHYTTLFENGSILTSYLGDLGPWEKETVSNYTTHRVYADMRGYVFYRNIDGVLWNSIITTDSYRATDRKRVDKNRLYFLPEVTLTQNQVKTGQIS